VFALALTYDLELISREQDWSNGSIGFSAEHSAATSPSANAAAHMARRETGFMYQLIAGNGFFNLPLARKISATCPGIGQKSNQKSFRAVGTGTARVE